MSSRRPASRQGSPVRRVNGSCERPKQPVRSGYIAKSGTTTMQRYFFDDPPVSSRIENLEGGVEHLDELVHGLTSVVKSIRDTPLRLTRDEITGRLRATRPALASLLEQPDEADAPNGAPTYTTKLLGAFFVAINGDERLGELLAPELLTHEYTTGSYRRIHTGLVFGSLDLPTCSLAVEAVALEMKRDALITERVMNRFWRDAHSGKFGIHKKIEFMFHLCVVVLDTLEKSGCDPAHVYKWERSLEQITSSLVGCFAGHNEYEVAVGNLIQQLCNRRLAPLVKRLSTRKCIIELAHNPYWKLAKSLFGLVTPDSKETRLKETIPWQLFIALSQEWLSQTAEQRSWLRFASMRGNITLFSLVSHFLGQDRTKMALDGVSPNSIGLKRDYVLPPSDMTISVQGQDKSVRLVHSWLLAAAWPYIVSMLSCGMAESTERLIQLPVDFPPEVLECILSNLYGVPKKLKLTTVIKAHMHTYEEMYGFKALFEKIELSVE